MKIIILGAGQVGANVAKNLIGAGNDITLIDRDPEALQLLSERIDVRTISGHAAHPDVLIRAGIEDADMILAVTNSDETNVVACGIAQTLFNTPTRLARVREPDYLAHPGLFGAGVLPLDFIISPEQLVTGFILRLITHPGVLQSLDFADGRLQLAAVRVDHDGPFARHRICDLNRNFASSKARVVKIFRQNHVLIPDADTLVEAGDEAFFVAAKGNVDKVVSLFRRADRPYRRIFIAGGGNLGKRMAEILEPHYRIKLVERDAARCRLLAQSLNRTIVLHGDASDESLLREADIERTDVYCAMTNDDEINILSAMLAKRLGVRKVIALINQPGYADIVQLGCIDHAISPGQITIGALMTHIRRGDVIAVHSLRRGSAEAIEAVAHGDRSNSRVVDRRIDELALPAGASVAAIARGDQSIFPDHDTRIESGDHILLFLADKRQSVEIEHLFQAGPSCTSHSACGLR